MSAWVTISILFRLAIKGYKRPLERSDLWSLNHKDTAEAVMPVFEKEWRKELLKNER